MEYICRQCYAQSPSATFMHNFICEACRRNNNLVESQRRVMQERDRYANTRTDGSISDLQRDISTLFLLLKQLESRIDEKMVALSEYLEGQFVRRA